MSELIIHVDRALCDGCGQCTTACGEDVLSMVDGKAELIASDYCDGFGECISACPTGALTLEQRQHTCRW